MQRLTEHLETVGQSETFKTGSLSRDSSIIISGKAINLRTNQNVSVPEVLPRLKISY